MRNVVLDLSAGPSVGGADSREIAWTVPGAAGQGALLVSTVTTGAMNTDADNNLRRSATAPERLYIAQARDVSALPDAITVVSPTQAHDARSTTALQLIAPSGWQIANLRVRVTDIDGSSLACPVLEHQPAGVTGAVARDYVDAVAVTAADIVARGANIVTVAAADGVPAHLTTTDRGVVRDHVDAEAAVDLTWAGTLGTTFSFAVDYWNGAEGLHGGTDHPSDPYQIIGLVFTLDLEPNC